MLKHGYSSDRMADYMAVYRQTWSDYYEFVEKEEKKAGKQLNDSEPVIHEARMKCRQTLWDAWDIYKKEG